MPQKDGYPASPGVTHCYNPRAWHCPPSPPVAVTQTAGLVPAIALATPHPPRKPVQEGMGNSKCQVCASQGLCDGVYLFWEDIRDPLESGELPFCTPRAGRSSPGLPPPLLPQVPLSVPSYLLLHGGLLTTPSRPILHSPGHAPSHPCHLMPQACGHTLPASPGW